MKFGIIPIGERGDDKTFSTSGVFVAVVKVDVGDLNQTSVHFLFEVETGLLQPFEITGRFDVHSALQDGKVKHENVLILDELRFRLYGGIHPVSH